MRSEDPLNITFSKESNWGDELLVEPMILIPLVENCFKHCDFTTNPAAYVKINLKVSGRQLFFSTLNTKDDQDKQKDQQGGVGLENIRRRLMLKYKDRHELEVSQEKETFEVKLLLQLWQKRQRSKHCWLMMNTLR